MFSSYVIMKVLKCSGIEFTLLILPIASLLYKVQANFPGNIKPKATNTKANTLLTEPKKYRRFTKAIHLHIKRASLF